MVLDFMNTSFFLKNFNPYISLFKKNFKFNILFKTNNLMKFKIKKNFYFKFYYFFNFKSKFKLNWSYFFKFYYNNFFNFLFFKKIKKIYNNSNSVFNPNLTHLKYNSYLFSDFNNFWFFLVGKLTTQSDISNFYKLKKLNNNKNFDLILNEKFFWNNSLDNKFFKKVYFNNFFFFKKLNLNYQNLKYFFKNDIITERLENQLYISKNPYKIFNNFLIDVRESEFKSNFINLNFRKFTKIFNNMKNLNIFKFKHLNNFFIKNINFDIFFYNDFRKKIFFFDKNLNNYNNFNFFKKIKIRNLNIYKIYSIKKKLKKNYTKIIFKLKKKKNSYLNFLFNKNDFFFLYNKKLFKNFNFKYYFNNNSYNSFFNKNLNYTYNSFIKYKNIFFLYNIKPFFILQNLKSYIYDNLKIPYITTKENNKFILNKNGFMYSYGFLYFNFKLENKLFLFKKFNYSFIFKNELQRYILNGLLKSLNFTPYSGYKFNYLDNTNLFGSENIFLFKDNLFINNSLFFSNSNKISFHLLDFYTNYGIKWDFEDRINVRNENSIFSNFNIKRVKFKPGYSILWRNARSTFLINSNLKQKTQYKLTKYLSKFKKYIKYNLFLNMEMRLSNVLLRSKFVFDMQTSHKFITSGLIYLNGTNCFNPDIQIYAGDLLQLIIHNKYYIFFKWLLNWYIIKKNRIKVRLKKKLNFNRLDFHKTRSFVLPGWLLSNRNLINDIPKFLEVDFTTLSVFVLYEPLFWSDINPANHISTKFGILNMYNWKYIT